MARLGFTLGEDIGIRLAEIAKDHLLNLDIDKAIAVWTESFGCDKSLAEKFSIGTYVVTVDESNKTSVNAMAREELQEGREKDYPIVDCKEIHRVIDKYFQTGRDVEEEFVFEDFRYLISTVNTIYCTNNDFGIDANLSSKYYDIFEAWIPKNIKFEGTIYVKPRVILAELLKLKNLYKDSEFIEFLSDVNTMNIDKFGDSVKINKLLYVTTKMLNVLQNRDKILQAEDFCIKVFNCDNKYKYRTERNIESIVEMLGQWMVLVQNPDSQFGGWATKEKEEKAINDYLEYIKS